MVIRHLKLVTDETRTDDLTPIDGLVSELSAHELAQALRSGRCPHDRVFDRYLPREFRAVSQQFWTPLRVVVRAACLFEEFGIRSVVDIGSGVGKFCIAAALASQCRFTGIEHRSRLVAVASDLARRFECDDRVRFIEGRFGAAATPPADAYYLFNPFEENVYPPFDWLDGDVELSRHRYREDLAAIDGLLRGAPNGTYLLTYNGFGGAIPNVYRRLRVETALPNILGLWQKAVVSTETTADAGE